MPSGPSGLISAAIDGLCLSLAVATAATGFDLPGLFSRNPFGWRELVGVGLAIGCVLAVAGFYRFLADLIWSGGLSARHSGHVAWWLVGGVWVTACAAALLAETPTQGSYLVALLIRLNTLLALPLLLFVLASCLKRHERARADWRSWVGFFVGCTFPITYVLVRLVDL